MRRLAIAQLASTGVCLVGLVVPAPGLAAGRPGPWHNVAVRQALTWVAGHVEAPGQWRLEGPASIYPRGATVSALARFGAGSYHVLLNTTPRRDPLNAAATRRGSPLVDWSVDPSSGYTAAFSARTSTGLWSQPLGAGRRVSLGDGIVARSYTAGVGYRGTSQTEAVLMWRQRGWSWEVYDPQEPVQHFDPRTAGARTRAAADKVRQLLARLPVLPARQGAGVVLLGDQGAIVTLAWWSQHTLTTLGNTLVRRPVDRAIDPILWMASSWRSVPVATMPQSESHE